MSCVLLLLSLAACPEPPKIPPRCALVWVGVEYRAAFEPGGVYEAKIQGTTWVGSWKLRGRTLCISESTTPHDPNSWSHYEVTLGGALRSGRITAGGSGEARIIPK
jgi:hypothetical protein